MSRRCIDIGICGFEKVFESFCAKNPSTADVEHDKDKVRDKYTEILDVVGIDKELLRAKEKVTDIDGRTVKSGTYIFPEQSVDFCATVIHKYTSSDFKELRKANFDKVTIGEIVFLIGGFRIMLRDLGYSEEVVLKQYNAMERLMKYKLRLAIDELECQLCAIHKLAEECERRDISFNYYDKTYFIRYMAFKMAATKCYIESVYGSYTDIRSEELSEIAYDESPQMSTERINKEMIFFDALEHNDKYQRLLRQQEKLIAEDTFIKNKQKRFKEIKVELDKIREQYQTELFGKLLDEEEDDSLMIQHPIDVLKEAVVDTDLWIKDNAERDEAESAKNPEDIERENAERERIRQWLEEHGVNLSFDLPNTDEQEEEIFVQSGNLSLEVKGTIRLPCFCKKGQITAYKGIKGKCAIKCPNCGYYIIVDYDNMTAEPLELYGPVRRIGK
ncbi:MAG: hypothetical protein J1F11_01415 [Oscillospiraceae bacterium]|nr:hypothetical protein [Oscillospiraceae bacterium]